MYLVAASGEARGPGNSGAQVEWTSGQKRWIEDEFILFYHAHPDVFVVGEHSVDPVQVAVENTGTMAAAYIHFSDAGEAGMKITIGGVDYQEDDEEDDENGVWTNGSSASDSAESLLAALTGDTRGALPFTAVADVSGAGVWLFWNEVGSAGNVTISETSAANCTVQSSTGGADATRRSVVNIAHTVSAQELLSGAIEIPMPFAPAGFHVNAFGATGAQVYFTDLVTAEEDPDRIRIAIDGDVNIADTDVVFITAWA